MKLPTDVESIGALADPVRSSLYEYVATQPDAVSREQCAHAVGITAGQAKFHLERLVDAGLLTTEQRRLTGRSGPGAGRPAKLYRRSRTPVRVALPERRHDLAGEILAEAIRLSGTGLPLPDAIERAAHDAGATALRPPASQPSEDELPATTPAHPSGASADEQLTAAQAALADIGYEPEQQASTVRLRNCPFDPLSRSHTDLICAMNHSYVGGVLDGLGCTSVQANLEPHETYCCVSLRAAASDARATTTNDGGAG